MSINEINAEAKESLRKYFKNSQDVKHENEARKELTKEEIFESVVGEIKESEMKLEQRNQMRNTLQQDAKEAFEKVCGKKSEAKEVEHMTLEGMKKELKEKYQLDISNQFGKEMHLMCNLSDLVEEHGIQQGMKRGVQSGI